MPPRWPLGQPTIGRWTRTDETVVCPRLEVIMIVPIWRFATIMPAALDMGMAWCHVLELPAKMRYDRREWTRVEQTLYRSFGKGGRWRVDRVWRGTRGGRAGVPDPRPAPCLWAHDRRDGLSGGGIRRVVRIPGAHERQIRSLDAAVGSARLDPHPQPVGVRTRGALRVPTGGTGRALSIRRRGVVRPGGSGIPAQAAFGLISPARPAICLGAAAVADVAERSDHYVGTIAGATAIGQTGIAIGQQIVV